MKLSAFLVPAAVAVVLSPAHSAFCQSNSTVPLTASPANFAYDSLTYRTKGLIGSSELAARATVQITSSGAATPASDPDVEPILPPGFYPTDVTNPKNHATVFSAQSHPIYINNPPSHWGNPGAFLTDFGKSDFIHVLDQYVGAFSNNRYTLGTSFLAGGYPIPADHTLQINDILTLVHAGAAIEGGGLGHIYHIFIPQGVDMCLPPASSTAAPQCYSPDNPSTFVFCAFHSAVTFSDSVGHVLFTVEPYQNVAGCNLPPGGSANSQLIDSTDDTLSHETSETISDPNLNAWWVHRLTIANGEEIGDLCVRAQIIGKNIYSKDATVNLNGHPYTIQAEYSDQVHGCPYSTAP